MHPTPGKQRHDGTLTKRQTQTLRIIQDWWGKFHYGPTFSEIAELLGPINQNGAVAKVEALERKGYVRRDRGVHRSIMLTDAGRAYLAPYTDTEGTI